MVPVERRRSINCRDTSAGKKSRACSRARRRFKVCVLHPPTARPPLTTLAENLTDARTEAARLREKIAYRDKAKATPLAKLGDAVQVAGRSQKFFKKAAQDKQQKRVSRSMQIANRRTK